MADTMGTALIAAGATIIGATIPSLSGWLKDRGGPFSPVIGPRQRSIVGEWEGTGGDQFVENGTPSIDLKATFSIRLSGRRVLAEATVAAGSPYNLRNKLTLSGGFCNDDLIQLSYRGADPSRVQYGVVLFRLSDLANQLTGNYAGFSPTRGCLIVGKFDLTRTKF